jgi:hypothetical protein
VFDSSTLNKVVGSFSGSVTVNRLDHDKSSPTFIDRLARTGATAGG